MNPACLPACIPGCLSSCLSGRLTGSSAFVAACRSCFQCSFCEWRSPKGVFIKVIKPLEYESFVFFVFFFLQATLSLFKVHCLLEEEKARWNWRISSISWWFYISRFIFPQGNKHAKRYFPSQMLVFFYYIGCPHAFQCCLKITT